jgi:hypothetical protein
MTNIFKAYTTVQDKAFVCYISTRTLRCNIRWKIGYEC